MPAFLAAVGGVAAIAQVIFAWEQVGSPGLWVGLSGADRTASQIILFLGMAVLALAVLWSNARSSRSVGAGIAAIGVLIVLVAMANYRSIQDEAAASRAAMDGVASALGQTPGSSLPTIGFLAGPGLYLAIAAGVIVAIGGLMGLLRKQS